jgi:hypothetical protein
MTSESGAGEYRHSRAHPSASMEKRRLVLLGYLIDLKAHTSQSLRRTALSDIEALRDHPSPDMIRSLERKWDRQAK